ncbi:glycosyltransferase family A protein [Yimella radicis]
MSSMTEVTVVIPCHQAVRTVGLQLEALSRQVDAPQFEVVLVDNRSTDGLAEYASTWANAVSALRVADAHDMAGAGYARNVGVAQSAAEKLLFCDADDLVAPDWVARSAEALDAVDLACGSDVTLADAEFTSVDAIWSEYFEQRSLLPLDLRSAPSDYPIVLGGNLAIRRSVYLDLRGYDPSMTLGNEDNDLAIRAERAGHLVHRAPAMRIAIRERSDLRGFYRRARVAARGHMQLCDRHDLHDVSPHLRGGAWRLDLPRSVVAAARMAGRPAAQRDWPAIATRLGAAIGLWEGQYESWRGTFPAPEPAVGLDDAYREIR